MSQLSISKRFEFAFSHKCSRPDWSDTQNQHYFGKEYLGRMGHGHNAELWISATGPVQDQNGMIIELADLKNIIANDVLMHIDHTHLNTLPAFETVIPTPENIAQHLWKTSKTVLSNHGLSLTELRFSPEKGDETIITSQLKTREITYQLLHPFWTLSPTGDHPQIEVQPIKLKVNMIHTSSEPSTLSDEAMSDMEFELFSLIEDWQESAMALSLDKAKALLNKIKLTLESHEFTLKSVQLEGLMISLILDDHQGVFVTTKTSFSGMHRLYNPTLSDTENQTCFGKCHRWHGHVFDVTVTADLNNKSESDMIIMCQSVLDYIVTLNGAVLNDDLYIEVPIVTCEVLIQYLNDQLSSHVPGIHTITLKETNNNSFTLTT